jgi:PAS domain S-box-containing protein
MLPEVSWKKTASALPSYITGLIIATIVFPAFVIFSNRDYQFVIIIIELVSIGVSIAIFSLVWNARRNAKDSFLVTIGLSFLFTAGMDAIFTYSLIYGTLLHEFTFNQSIQIWIVARYFQSITLIIAMLLIGRSLTRNGKHDAAVIAIPFAAITTILVLSVLEWHNFPVCDVLMGGYTPFKIASEYVISAIFIAGLLIIARKRGLIDPSVRAFLLIAQFLLIAGELSFAISGSVFVLTNFLGFYFRFVSVYFVYMAIVVVGIIRPFDLLFHNLKQSEQALRMSEERYRKVVEDQTELISRFLPDGTHVFVNDAYCRFFGLSCEAILGKKFLPQTNPAEKERIRISFASLTKEHPVITDVSRIVLADGSIHWVRWNDRAIFDTYGTVLEYQSVGRDITEMRQANDALELAHRKLTLLSSITRHDLLNQLTALKTYLELVGHEEKNPVNSGYLEKMRKITDVIDEQISFTKDYEDMGTYAPVWQEVETGVRRSVAALPMRNVRTVIDLEDVEVFADPLFEKVFYNLIDNALRYGGAKLTTIRISVTESGAVIILSCADDGNGISLEDRKRLFEKGFGKHTGLGLFLVREILSITGITIVETGTPGLGARFDITIPRKSYRFPAA